MKVKQIKTKITWHNSYLLFQNKTIVSIIIVMELKSPMALACTQSFNLISFCTMYYFFFHIYIYIYKKILGPQPKLQILMYFRSAWSVKHFFPCPKTIPLELHLALSVACVYNLVPQIMGKNWPLPFLKKQSSILPSFPN